MPLSRICGCSS